MKAILTLLVAAMIAPAATYSYTAVGTAAPPTSGSDPFGVPWQISISGGNVVFSIPGPTPWLCPGCLTDVYVSAQGQSLGSAPAPLLANGSAPNMFHDITANNFYPYNFPSPGNTVHFDILSGGGLVSGHSVEAAAYFLNPLPPGALYAFTVTYVTADCETPEPGSFALLGAGMIGLALFKRRRVANH